MPEVDHAYDFLNRNTEPDLARAWAGSIEKDETNELPETDAQPDPVYHSNVVPGAEGHPRRPNYMRK
ncbi:hypothetical protein CLF_102528 [Clonorchis sinensis]|uniref:Uncharacterized protein n=1 Tax=Clonorchis sinensis TaxID=79923 RepID=G7YN36_CLOSI|nr:hypothetical protein CLF_102528 [Clonorchis sinensis]